MNLKNKISAVFPTEEQIPTQYNLESPLLQNEYLVNGDRVGGTPRERLQLRYATVQTGLLAP